MWVLVVLSGLAAFVALALSVPIDLTVRADFQGEPRFTVRIEWLFGLVVRKLNGRKKKAEGRKPTRARGQARDILDILRTEGLLKQVRRLLKDVFRRIKVRELKADFRVGLDNPVETGILFAMIRPAGFLAGLAGPFDVHVQPDFDEKVFEGYVHGQARLRPIRLVIPCLRFFFSRPVIRTLQKLVRRRWERR